MKKILTYIILPLLIVALAYFSFKSIEKPISFERDKTAREAICIERMKEIRTLQVAYKSVYNKFTADVDSLINFYKYDSIIVVKQVGSWDDSVAVAQKRVYRDTIKIPVRDTLLKDARASVDSIAFIPYSGGKRMIMRSVVAKVSGVDVPLFEAAAPFDILLNGLERQLIVNLKSERRRMNKYEGLKVGSVDAPNNNAGNWE